jgi:hypothetical protein
MQALHLTANRFPGPGGRPDKSIGRPALGWSAYSSCPGMCPRFLQCTADLCALRQASHLSPAGRPCPRAWARASTDVSATTCPSDRPAMGPGVARRPGTAQPPTNVFHTTFSRGNSAGNVFVFAGKASEALGRGFASFRISTRGQARQARHGTLENP